METECTCPGEEGVCPYDEEVGDEVVLCNCCESCVEACQEAI